MGRVSFGLSCPLFSQMTYEVYLLPVRTSPVIKYTIHVKNLNRMQNAADLGGVLSM